MCIYIYVYIYIKKQTNFSKSTIQHNSKNNNNKEEKPRKISQTKNILSGQNHKDTDPQTKKDKTIRN